MNQLTDPATSAVSLRIRPVRLFGRRVNGCAISIPASGLIMGGENGALSLDAALHVLPQHAEVRAEADGFHLVPGCGVVALNGERLDQQASRRLLPGDCVEIGFAALRVEANDLSCPDGYENACDKTATNAIAPRLVPGFLPGFFPDKASAHSPAPEAETQPQDAPQEPASSEAEALLALLLKPEEGPIEMPVAEGTLVAEDAEHEKRTENTESAENAEREIKARRAAARLEIMTMPEVTDTGLVPSPAPRQKSAEPANILTALAKESARVLAGGRMEATSPFAAIHPVPVSRPETNVFAPAAQMSAASSLEEILEGPINIDDVLENLRRQAPQADTQNPATVHDVLAAMAAPPRAPDPLRLLAGLDDQLPLREPELPPVLGREHRSPGMSTPYSGGHSGTQPPQNAPPLPESENQTESRATTTGQHSAYPNNEETA